MMNPLPIDPEAPEDFSLRRVWLGAIGRVFKLTSKAYGVRTVTYTQVKAVKDTGRPDVFDIEVLCAEIVARVLDGKRAHSNICKQGVIRHEAGSDLHPASFGQECELAEFEKVTNAILAYTNTYLDWVMHEDPEDRLELEVTIDLPHLALTDMEASLLRNSPFLVKNVYFLTANSVQAAFESIKLELLRASRHMRLTDAVDPVYVEQKNRAVASLHRKLNRVSLDPYLRRPGSNPATPSESARSASPAPAEGSAAEWSAVKIDSLSLALLGKPSATLLAWQRLNPSQEGAVYTLGEEHGLLQFVRWAHAANRKLTEAETAKKSLPAYFTGMNQSYTGPDKDGIYPVLKPA